MVRLADQRMRIDKAVFLKLAQVIINELQQPFIGCEKIVMEVSQLECMLC